MKKLQEIKFTIAIVTFLHLISSKTVLSQNGGFTCVTSGRFPNAEDCSKYYECLGVYGRFYLLKTSCPLNLLFDSVSRICVKPSKATCGTSTSTASTAPTTTISSAPNLQTPNQCAGSEFFCNSHISYINCTDDNFPVVNCEEGYLCNTKCTSPCLNHINHC